MTGEDAPGTAPGSKIAQQRRGASDCGEYRQAAEAAAFAVECCKT
jgi:hypothetical protein